jgi:hypothetical protein
LTVFDDGIQDFNCGTYSSTQSIGNKGLTIWGPKTTDIHLTSGQTSDPLYFTGTKPKCYSNSPSFCNVTYTLHTGVTSSSDVVGPITMTLCSSKGTSSVSRYHSKVQGHDLIETHDVSQPPATTMYNDTSWNYLTFTNGANVDVWIQGLQVVRGYDMNNLATDMQTPCPCQTDATEAERPDFASRLDYPCNYENCGGLSFTTHAPDNHVYYTSGCPNGTILRPNQTYTWTWTNPSAVTHNGISNYVGPSHCLFNFNNVQLCDDNGNTPSNLQATTDDIAFMLSLDNSHWSTFYHCKNNLNMAHSIDLATHSYLSQYYNDAPNGSNTLYLRIINNPGVNLLLIDGGLGLLNLYRVYRTSSLCQTITVYQSSGGTISPGTTTVKQGESKTFTITPNQGGQVTHVWTDGIDRGAISSYTFSEVLSPHTISATFSGPHVITVSYGTGGFITPDTIQKAYGSSQVFYINHYAGYITTHVYVDDVDQGPITTYTFNNIVADHTISATFYWPTYTITASAGSGGSISPSGNVSVDYNGRTFNITPNPGYYISDVRVDGNSVGIPASYTFTCVEGNHTIQAYFSQQPSVSISATIGGWYDLNPSVYFDGNYVGTAPLITQMVPGAHTLTLSDPTPDTMFPGFDATFSCFIDQNNNYYYNGQSIQIPTTNYTIVAFYNPGWQM